MLSAIEVIAVLHMALAGAFAFAFARGIGLGHPAAGAAGLGFMLSGFVVSRAIWFTPAICALPWLPLGLLAIERIAGAEARRDTRALDRGPGRDRGAADPRRLAPGPSRT